MWSRYFKQCHGIIFIIDSTDTERFQECYETLIDIAHDDIWMQIDDDDDNDNDNSNVDGTVNVPILMMANKQDLPQAVDLVSLKTGVFIKLVSGWSYRLKVVASVGLGKSRIARKFRMVSDAIDLQQT